MFWLDLEAKSHLEKSLRPGRAASAIQQVLGTLTISQRFMAQNSHKEGSWKASRRCSSQFSGGFCFQGALIRTIHWEGVIGVFIRPAEVVKCAECVLHNRNKQT